MKKTPVFEYYTETVVIPLGLPDGGERGVEITPGVAFGRGFHPTTRLCVKALENLYLDNPVPEKVLDVGCGSGVLSICASLLGAEEVAGLDIDNMIVSEAIDNVSANGQSSKVKIILGSIEDVEGDFDLVTANVLIGSMLPMSEELAKKVKPGGLLLLSGIKEEESDTVLERFSGHGLRLLKKDTEREWAALLLSN